ncbi:hypothetical protein KAR91_51015 [Candidatus Pacearchaeota archaeon]|nr:hypothetical protein [Candidatus Pacearchaeota archaeon]
MSKLVYTHDQLGRAVNIGIYKDDYEIDPEYTEVENVFEIPDPITLHQQTYLDILNKRTADKLQKQQDIIDNLPSWQTVSDSIDNAMTIAAMKIIVKKLARIVYWLAKNSST